MSDAVRDGDFGVDLRFGTDGQVLNQAETKVHQPESEIFSLLTTVSSMPPAIF